MHRSLLFSLLFSLLLAGASTATASTPHSAETVPPTTQTIIDTVAAPYNSSHARPPIVLVHGWQGSSFDLPCGRTTPAYVDELWGNVDAEFTNLGFHVELARLYSGGATAATGPSDPNWHCTPVAEENVPNLIEAIDAAKTATGQSKVILVTHSMGGLVSRAYLESPLYRDDVVALYTLGTPHVGVPVDTLSGLVTWLTLGSIDLETYCAAQPVVCQFSDDEAFVNAIGYTGIETFNTIHSTRAPGVAYHLLGGDIGFDHRSVTCDPLYLLIPGANDCIVPLPSALGLSSADNSLGPLSGVIDRLEVYAAHIESFNDLPLFGCDYTYNFKNKDEYCVLALNQELPSNSMTSCLAPSIDGRLGAHICGTASAVSSAPAASAENSVVHLPIQRGSLRAGASHDYDIDIPAGLTLVTVYYATDMTVTLTTPDGTTIDTASAAALPDGVRVKLGANATGVTLFDMPAGTLRVSVEAAEAGAYAIVPLVDTGENAADRFGVGLGPDSAETSTAPFAAPPAPQIDTSSHTCTVSNPGPYLPSDTIDVSFAITLVDEDAHVEWLDHYYADGPNAWDVTTQSTPPADASGWGRTTATDACDSEGIGYWGIESPHISQTTVVAPHDLQTTCDLGLDALPVSGSHNGPWLTTGPSRAALGPEGFETTVPPAGWLMVQTENPDNGSAGWQQSSAQANSGSFSAFHNDDSTCFFCTGDFESWLVMPAHIVRAGDRLTWSQYVSGSSSGFGSDFDIWVSQGSPDPNDGDFNELANLSYTPKDQWNARAYDLTEYTGKSIYLAFRYYGDEDEALYLDDVALRNDHIVDTTYTFDLTYTVAADPALSCPGSPYVGVSSAENDPQSGLVGVAYGDLVDYSVNTAACNVASPCPLPQATLTKTVSVDGTCPGSASVIVPINNQTVTYCFQVENSSTQDVTLTDYVLTDSAIGLSATVVPSQTIASGETALIYQTDYTYSGDQDDCFSNSASMVASTTAGLGQPQAGGADVPFVETTYSVTAATPPDATEVCIGAPTAIELASFSASLDAARRVMLRWETAAEWDHAGFNVYRSPDAAFDATQVTQVNTALIAAQGSLGQGSAYALADNAPAGIWFYYLEDVDTNGVRTVHGPVRVAAEAPTSAELSQFSGSAPAGIALFLVSLTVVAIGTLAIRRRVL